MCVQVLICLCSLQILAVEASLNGWEELASELDEDLEVVRRVKVSGEKQLGYIT